jgi:phosphoserine phosphatase RsbU/P
MRHAAVNDCRASIRLSPKGTMIRKLRIIHLDDDFFIESLIHALLVEEGYMCDITRVETKRDFSALLEKGGFDLVLAELTLPAFDGMTALSMTRDRCLGLPFIFVTDTIGEEAAMESLKNGADDYVLKGRLSRLVSAVRCALREQDTVIKE